MLTFDDDILPLDSACIVFGSVQVGNTPYLCMGRPVLYTLCIFLQYIFLGSVTIGWNVEMELATPAHGGYFREPASRVSKQLTMMTPFLICRLFHFAVFGSFPLVFLCLLHFSNFNRTFSLSSKIHTC